MYPSWIITPLPRSFCCGCLIFVSTISIIVHFHQKWNRTLFNRNVIVQFSLFLFAFLQETTGGKTPCKKTPCRETPHEKTPHRETPFFAAFMLLRLLLHFSLVLAFQALFVLWWILSSCFDDVSSDDVWSSNLRSLTSLVSNKLWTAFGILCLLTSGISCPWLLYV